jgi:integrase
MVNAANGEGSLKKKGDIRRAYNVLYRFRKDLTAAGVPRIRFHDLRETAATLLSHGEQLNVVAKILGHTDPAMPLRWYAHVLPDAKEGAVRRMESYSF